MFIGDFQRLDVNIVDFLVVWLFGFRAGLNPISRELCWHLAAIKSRRVSELYLLIFLTVLGKNVGNGWNSIFESCFNNQVFSVFGLCGETLFVLIPNSTARKHFFDAKGQEEINGHFTD